MYLIPFIRFNRAIATTLIIPNETIKAIAISEIISVIGPFLNPYMYKKILSLTLVLMYIPNYSLYFMDYYNEEKLIYNQAEICSLLLFVLTLVLQK